MKRFEADDIDGDIAEPSCASWPSRTDPGDYETFLERYRDAARPQEEQRYLRGLGGFSEERVALDAADKCVRASSELRTRRSLLGCFAMNATTGPSGLATT